MVQDHGSEMQKEFDKNVSEAAMVNYSKVKSAGEIQDELRGEGGYQKTNG